MKTWKYFSRWQQPSVTFVLVLGLLWGASAPAMNAVPVQAASATTPTPTPALPPLPPDPGSRRRTQAAAAPDTIRTADGRTALANRVLVGFKRGVTGAERDQT